LSQEVKRSAAQAISEAAKTGKILMTTMINRYKGNNLFHNILSPREKNTPETSAPRPRYSAFCAIFANPKIAERQDKPLVALGGMAGLYARQNGLAERRNVP